MKNFAIIVLLALPGVWAQTGLQAGAARREITPREPVPMWGYGARHDKLSDGVLDPLYAVALVIQAGSHKIAIVGLDLGRSPNERSLQIIRKRILDEAGIENSFIAGSHTHHGPVLELTDEAGKGKGKFDAALRYYGQLEDSIVAAIVEANKKLVPAKIAAGSTQLEGFNTNRQTKLTPKTSDRELAVLRVDDASGHPIAILVNFAAHPTLLPSSLMKFSADYVGMMKNAVARETGATVLFMQGAAGDQSVERTGHSDPQSAGEALGREVIQLSGSLKPQDVANPSLTVREDRFQFGSRTNFKDPFTTMAFGAAFFPELVPNYLDEYKDGIRPRLTVATLNQDIAFIGVSGEFFSNHSLRLKERARVPHLFFLGYCNGYHQYFPTIEAVAEGGYGADREVSPVEIGAGEQLMNKALLWLYQMRGKIK